MVRLYIIRLEAEVSVLGLFVGTPTEFLESFCDLELRKGWEPLYKDGVLVENISISPSGETLDGYARSQVRKTRSGRYFFLL